MGTKYSQRQKETRDSLPDDLKLVLDDFITDYRYAVTIRDGRSYVSYIVTALVGNYPTNLVIKEIDETIDAHRSWAIK